MNKKILDYSISSITKEGIPFLKKYLYKALFIPPDSEPYQKSIVNEPIFKSIYENWGRNGNIAFMATDNKSNSIIGMVWVRLYNKINEPFGIIDNSIPALTIAVDEKYRNKGIGTALLEQLINEIKNQGFESISLSVDKRNYAIKLYKKFGFQLYKESKNYNPIYLLNL